MHKPKPKIRIAVIGSCCLFRELIALAFEKEEDIRVTAESDDIRASVGMAREKKADVILMEVAAGKSDALDLLPEIRNAAEGIKVLLIGAYFKDDEIPNYITAGAKGCISAKTACKKDLFHAVRAVHKGEFWIERKIAAQLLERGLNDHFKKDNTPQTSEDLLTPREGEIIGLVAKGLSNKEIANALFISDKTVKSHMNRIFKKLHLKRRVEVLIYAIKEGGYEDN